MGTKASAPSLLLTGFGPFPGATENPTEALVRTLATEPPENFGAGELTAIVLVTEYERSWSTLQRVLRRNRPDIVVHFGLHRRAKAIHVEALGRNRLNPEQVDAAGYAPLSGRARRFGPETILATYAADRIVAALAAAGVPAAISEDAGGYVCNATLYRSLYVAPPGRKVGLIHVPPNLEPNALLAAARTILTTACKAFVEPT